MLTYKIPDYFITLFFTICGSIAIGFIFFNYPGSFSEFFNELLNTPVIFMAVYLWAKAVILDFQRIHKKEKLTMPGYVFLVYGLSFFMFWIIQDLTTSSILEPSKVEEFFYLDNPTFFWVILEMTTSVLFIPINIKKGYASSTEKFLLLDILRSVALLFAFMIFDLILMVF